MRPSASGGRSNSSPLRTRALLTAMKSAKQMATVAEANIAAAAHTKPNKKG
jgi:hypothetical protein